MVQGVQYVFVYELVQCDIICIVQGGYVWGVDKVEFGVGGYVLKFDYQFLDYFGQIGVFGGVKVQIVDGCVG